MKEDKKFIDCILDEYESNLSLVFMRWKRHLITDAEMLLCRAINVKWLSRMMGTVDSFEEKGRDELSDELVRKYDRYGDTLPLSSVIFYRDREIPCYDDDCGQQVVAVFDEESWSGGSYNLHYASYFLYRVDMVIDGELWDSYVKEAEDKTAQ